MSDMSEKSAKVLVLRPRNPGRYIHTITQEDILELMWRSNQLNEAREAYLEQREFIRVALISGAQAEPGVHSVWLEDRAGGPVPRFSYSRLVVR